MEKVLRPSHRREMAMNAVMQRGTSIALACRTFQISEICYRYSSVLSDRNKEIADWLERLTKNKRTLGFGLCFLYLRNVQGYGWATAGTANAFTGSTCELELKPADQAKDAPVSINKRI